MNPRTPSVSVILPVFNAAAALPRALASVARQTVRDWELIAIDDGSSDSSLQICQNYAARDSRVRVLSKPHTGIVPTLSAGLELARAPILARMDADDEAHPERLAAQLHFLIDHRQVGLVGSLVEFGGDRGRSGGYALHVDWMNQLITPEAISRQRFVESPFAHPSVTFRRELVERHGGYRDGDFPEDYELWLRWLDAGVQMAKVPRVLLIWNDPPHRVSRTDRRYRSEAFYQCKAIYLARWLRRNVHPSRRILVWGAGRPTRKRAGYLLPHGVRISGYIDIDPRKIGREFSHLPVIGPADIPSRETCFLLGYVAKRGAHEVARTALEPRGFVEGEDFLMAA